MKQYMKWLPVLALGMTVGSCADDAVLPYSVQKPASIAQYEYLNDYDVLKSYVDRTKNPGFKLGLAVAASDFVGEGVVHEIVTTNFDEMTAGNEMKYASVVADDGTMDFSTVSSFMEAARAVGTTVYGHTLGWHAQQNMTYLNGLIADREMEADPDNSEEISDLEVVYSVLGFYPYWKADGVDVTINSDGNLLIYNPEVIDFWQYQYQVATGLVASPDIEYKVTVMIRASDAGYLTCYVGDWSNSQTKDLAFTTEWSEVELSFTGVETSDGFVLFQSGNFAGEIEVEWIRVTHEEVSSTSWSNMLTNSDCESDDTSCFYATELTDGPKAATFGAVGTGADGVGRAIVVKSGDNPTNTWDSQFFVRTPETMVAGEKYRFSMKYRADKAATCETQAHNEPGGYVWYSMFATNPTFSTAWQEFVYEGTISEDQAGTDGMNTIAFNLSVLPEANNYYFDDIKWKSEATMSLTPEEKKNTLT